MNSLGKVFNFNLYRQLNKLDKQKYNDIFNQHSLHSIYYRDVEFYKNLQKYDIPECESPIFVRNMFVPCGHCPLCARRAKRDWIVRCFLEFHKWRCGEFVTLTFDDEHLQDTSYDVVQKFLKRLRKNYKCKFKYFVAYENGEKSGRAHYHILLFGFHRPYPINPCRWNESLAQVWQNGLVKAVPMSYGNIPYVCGYVQKKLLFNEIPDNISRREFSRLNLHSLNDYELSFALDKPFHRKEFVKMSKGLGFSVLNNLKRMKKVLKQGYFVFNKYKYAIPRALLLKFKELGNDWLCMDVFQEYECKKEKALIFRDDSFLNTFDFSFRDIKQRRFSFYESIRQWLDSRISINKQKCMNILKLRS